MNVFISKRGMIPFVFAGLNYAHLQPGPAIARWLAELFGKAYQGMIWSLCAGIVLMAFVHSRSKRALSWDWACTVAALSILAVISDMTMNANESVHMLQYGVLGYLLAVMTSLGNIQAFLVGSFLGMLDEIIQAVLPGRFFEVRDVLMNLTAVSAGIILSSVAAEPRQANPR